MMDHEAEEIDHTYFVSIHRELCLIEEHAWWADLVLGLLQFCKMEIRFLERFSGWVTEKEYEDSIINKELTTTILSLKHRFRCICVKEGKELAALLSLVRGGYISDWEVFTWNLKPLLDDSKLLIKEWCKCVLSSSMTSKPDEILLLLDAVLNNLRDLLSYKAGKAVPMNDNFETLEEKLIFLQIFLKLNARCIHNKEFQELESRIHIFVNYAACQTFLRWVEVADEDDAIEMDFIISKILFEIPFMPDVMAPYLTTLRYEGLTSDDIVRHIDDIVNSLKHLVSYKAGEILPLMKKQIETLEQKLVFLQNFLKLAANCINSEEFRSFMNLVLDFSENAASLAVHYWLKQGDEQIVYEMNLQKIEPCTPDVTALYFGTLKAMKLKRSDTPLLGQTVVSFVDLLLENLVTVPSKDGYQILQEELIFVLTFLADPPIENANDDELTSVLKQIDVLLEGGRDGIWDRSSLVHDMKKVFSKRKVLYFRREIEPVNAKIRRLYCHFQHSLSYDFPKIIGRGFLDFLIQHLRNLKEKQMKDATWVSFPTKTILKIEEKLVSLRPLFNDFFELQKDKQGLSDTWLQVINLAYLTEHVINSCFVFANPIWYHMAQLHDVLNRINDGMTKLEKISKCTMDNDGDLLCSGDSTSILSKQAGTSEINQVVVGFEKETNTIIDQLKWGHKSLDIISIVGMAGLGKTTLARKVYDDPSVKSHFHIFAFCSISRDHNAKRLLLDILSNIIVIDDILSMTIDDLAHRLWQCLSGRKYLIVMDDVWEVRAWNDVKISFPNDENGSRIVFTTRFNKVAMEAQIKSSPYQLGFLSDEKSWELLQKKVFTSGSCSPEFSDIGKLIAKNCKGLPLAVVVIAGLLARTEPSLSWWSEIAERIGSFLFEEQGYMNMLEFSYMHLPEYLKPMLLYFGAFPEDTLISVKSLMLLWIDEGFVYESKTKSLEDVAKDYLRDFVDRSLIIVTGKSSNGGVKTVVTHDLIHDFCRIKARAENFFKLRCGTASSSSSHNHIYNHHYRLCMHIAYETIVDAPTYPCVHSLLSFQRRNDPFDTFSIMGKLKLVQVLHLDNKWLEGNDLEQMCLLVHLRHIAALIKHLVSVPSSISNLCALETLILRTMSKGDIILPGTIWKMIRLRHVNISRCRLTFTIGQHEQQEAYSQLENVVSFSSPTLSTGKQLEDLLQRLPAVRKLSCIFDKSRDYDDKRVEALDFHGRLETLNLSYIGYRSPYVIKFPSTLKKLKLVGVMLPWTAMSDIGKLERLEVLKLLWNSFVGPRWDVEDVEFPSLKSLKLNALNVVTWNAVPDSFPCLEQLMVIGCDELVEIPACFGELSTLKRFEVHDCNKKASSCATQVKNEQMELGNESLEVEITNSY